MWVADRHRRILDLLQAHQRLTTERFAEDLGVSRETVRRDLIELERMGQLARVHGGAVPPSGELPEPAYAERTSLHAQEKRQIARLAATLIQPGQACFMDAGSTTMALAHELAAKTELLIITNSLEAAQVLARHTGNDVRLLGGRVEADVPATYGAQTVSEIGRLSVEMAFVSPVSFDCVNGAMDHLWHEATVARAMLGRARQRVVLADASKLGQVSRIQICPAPEVDVLITNAAAGAAWMEACLTAGVSQVLAA